MRCKYCFYADVSSLRKTPNYGKMSERTMRRLLSEAFALNPSRVSFAFQGGEPTLAGLDFFRASVEEAKKLNEKGAKLDWSLQTNGLVLDDSFAAFLAENQFLVGLSLDGNKYITDTNRVDKDGVGVFARVMHAAELLRRHGVEFNILSVVTERAAKMARTQYRFFTENGFRHLQFIPCIDDFGSEETNLTPAAYGRFLKELFDCWYADIDLVRGDYVSVRNFDNYVNMLRGFPPENCAMSGRCGNYFVVESDGSLYPCDFYCTDEYRLGNVFDAYPFSETERARTFVEQSYLRPEKCAECEFYPLCRGGCRRDREPDLVTNRYCEAYLDFFRYTAPRMQKLAAAIGKVR